ncbi:MAG: hypothetical protein K2G41_04635 [Duncaniella sp.]|uniref:hypothetical protein n=1 Tax=Duncaniella sp. TaxID=2518496 RepID=UPI0023C8762A|nr:hypothetical protein [Duncaniella sp.]MDE6089968.1 hypothetical protein [Duncaniella sp.]
MADRVREFFATKLRRRMPTASDRLRLGCVKEYGSLPQFFLLQNWVFRFFSLATLALLHLSPPYLYAAKKQPGREKPKGFKPKGKKF